MKHFTKSSTKIQRIYLPVEFLEQGINKENILEPLWSPVGITNACDWPLERQESWLFLENEAPKSALLLFKLTQVSPQIFSSSAQYVANVFFTKARQKLQ